jgi:two-component system sensor histidine kinase CpxA
MRNADRYAPDSGPLLIKAERIDKHIIIKFADNGPGVPPDTLELLCEPFYRPESSRNRSSGGVGLGLAIVKTCIESCQGSVALRNRQPTGLEVEIKLFADSSRISSSS